MVSRHVFTTDSYDVCLNVRSTNPFLGQGIKEVISFQNGSLKSLRALLLAIKEVLMFYIRFSLYLILSQIY